MIVIGENINSTRKAIAPLIDKQDGAAIVKICRDQQQAGASYLDLNAGAFLGRETALLSWLVDTVQAEVDLPLCIDTPSAPAAAAALPRCRRKPILNSVSGEKARLEGMLPLLREHKPGVIVMPMDDEGMPKDLPSRLSKLHPLVEKLLAAGLAPADLFIDPLVFPVGADQQNALIVLDSIAAFRKEFPGCQVVCGLSNVSHGLPARKFINQAFLVMAVLRGLSAVILNPLDHYQMALLNAALVLTAQDEFAMNYIACHERGALNITATLEKKAGG